jgi:hypothetical protein
VGVHEGLVYSIPIDTIEVLRKRVENAATTIRNKRGMLKRVEEVRKKQVKVFLHLFFLVRLSTSAKQVILIGG